jgi:hypothetical protein
MKIIPCTDPPSLSPGPPQTSNSESLTGIPFFGTSLAQCTPAEPPHSFSSPGSGDQFPPRTGIGDRKQFQSFKKTFCPSWGSGVFKPLGADE